MNDIQQEKLLTVREAAETTRMSQAWWRAKLRHGEVRFVRIGERRIFIPYSSIEKLFSEGFIESKKIGG